MISKNMIISGFVSGIMLAATSFATPASAGQVSFNLDIGIENLLNELITSDDSGPYVQKIDYRNVPIRKIHRKMRRRGLYPVSEYRVRGDRVIIRAEDDYGTLFRVVADADYGDILKIRRIRAGSTYRPAPVDPPYYDDGYNNYRPGYDRPAKRNKPRYDNSRANRKARKDAEHRAHAKRKAANRAHAQRKAANARAHASRKAAQNRNHAARKAAKIRADRNRRSRAQSRPRTQKPYVGISPEEYKKQQYGGGR